VLANLLPGGAYLPSRGQRDVARDIARKGIEVTHAQSELERLLGEIAAQIQRQ